eukprot:TRINITY_DN68073_c0_g1_i1.p1 TRINITY_DN68073_c0_g1~~TRINITY_DN68073_c0_g1_i1.p1  ORF type:complete len:404 (+),score=92.39 TRINITY_DN68073_c0_g1_i1:159-1370(+)
MGCVVAKNVATTSVRRISVERSYTPSARQRRYSADDKESHYECEDCGGSGLFCLVTGLPHTHTAVADGTEEKRADRIYLMGVYDSRTLLFDLLCYIRHGTTLTVFPDCALYVFWLEANSATVSNIDPMKARLHYGVGKPALQSLGSTPLSRITEIRLGGGAPQLAPSKTATAGSANLLVFSLVFDVVDPLDADHSLFKGTLTLGAKSTQELEAWVITLASVANLPPAWSCALDVSQYDGYSELDTVERAACSSHNIPPKLFVRVQGFIRDKVAEVQRCTQRSQVRKVICGVGTPVLRGAGALQLSKGELRYWTGVDIFRTSIIWTLLARNDLVYDDHFKFATPNVPLYTLWFWSQANHVNGSSSLRHIIKAVLLCLNSSRLRKKFHLPDELLTIIFVFLPLFP